MCPDPPYSKSVWVVGSGHVLPRLHTGTPVRHERSDGAGEGQVAEGGGVLQHCLSVPVSKRDGRSGCLGVNLDDVSGGGGGGWGGVNKRQRMDGGSESLLGR